MGNAMQGTGIDSPDLEDFLNPYDVIFRLRLTRPCPVDMKAVYAACMHVLDLQDWRQANLDMCISKSALVTNNDGPVHFQVECDAEDKIMWANLPADYLRPVQGRAFLIPQVCEGHAQLQAWVEQAEALDRRLLQVTGILDMNLYSLRNWRQVKRNWPELAKCLLACMSEDMAAGLVANVCERISKQGKWDSSTRMMEKMVAAKPRDRVINSIQAGLLLPDNVIQAWVGYYHTWMRGSKFV